MSEIVISVSGLKKTYRNYKSNFQKLKHMLFVSNNAGEKVKVFRNVSFDISRGEKVGIITAPESGKSTIISILAGIIKPDAGETVVNGTVTTLLSHRLGFETALTGRDNYEIRATLLGWPKEVIDERESAIFKFAGLTKEIDQPIRTYKRGLASLLGFAISTTDKPDIFLVDEKFVFGGKRNVKKAVGRLRKLIADEDVTFVMAVNDPAVAEQLCDRGIVIHRGKVVFDGAYSDADQYFKEHCNTKKKKKTKDNKADKGEERDQESEVQEGEDESVEDSEDLIL